MDNQADGLREVMKEQRRSKRPLRIIGITSGKGGVGKTNVAANLGVIAAKQGMRVLIIDGDMGLANVEILYGIRPRHHLGHLLQGDVSARDVLATTTSGVKVLPAGNGLQQLTRLDDAQRLRLVSALEELEDDFDVVLLDSGAGIGDNVLFFVGAAQEALLVVSPEPTSLTDAYATIKVLCQDAGVRYFDVVVNQAGNETQARDIFQKLTAVAGRFLDAKVRWLGWVPRDENVHRAVMAQRPLVELFPSSPATRALNGVADALFNEPPPAHLAGGLKFLWSRLLRDSNAA
ncbi:MAG: MinD/ParA family protein [Archangium sp.]|nr:MinD/ParA family protein [Archangium sp.]MDP3155044.1 MinD/ParA family protein [Archangium sp.]MDP3574472.1 MinD/ParA family protein [Archangium sp.]